ncbi:MAG: rRNA pseudouridine synthase [Anaerolineaceae bacterium]|nr:MAG: rRNA pseudouridine synthase [Anaerolineaceae bacterium]
MKSERLQKVLARSGYGSRRSCEALIKAGRVTINGQVAELGALADPEVDEIFVDGDQLKPPEKKIYIMLNKPVGVLSSLRSQGGKPTVDELVKSRERLYPVGRLDLNSEGLLLLTNDGELTNRLTHPRYEHEKEYRVLLNKIPDASQLESWRRGVLLADGSKALPADVWLENDQASWLRVVMRQGRKRQIRETARVLGLHVLKLIRVRIGTLKLGNLKPGQSRELSKNEIYKLFGLSEEA